MRWAAGRAPGGQGTGMMCVCVCGGDYNRLAEANRRQTQGETYEAVVFAECRRGIQTEAGGVVLYLRARANGRVGSITTTPYANSPSPRNYLPLPPKTLRHLVFHFPTTGIPGKYSAVVRFGVEEDNGATERHGKAPGTFMWSAKYTVCWKYL
jgi:hypothetical protein